MPRPRSPASRPADIEVRHRMDFTPVPGGPRPLPPFQGFPLPSSIQPLPVSSPSTGLSGVQDFAWLQTTGRLTSQLHLQEKACLLVASLVARSGPDPLLDMQSILATMQDTFLQQVKGLLGVAPPQPSLGPSVPTDMAFQTRWPSPQRRYSPYQSSCSSSRHRSPRRASSHHSRSSSGESCHQNRGLNSA